MVIPEMISKFITSWEGATLVKISYMDVNSKCVAKTIHLQDYIRLLNGATSFEVEPDIINVGKLPKGYVDASISTDGSFKAVIKVEKHEDFFSLNGHKSKNYVIPFPTLLFYLSIGKTGNILSGNVFALKDGELKDDTILYQYPFGNVNSKGHICFGSIQEKAKTLSELDNIVTAFFQSATSNHYYVPEVYSTLNLPQEALADYLSELKEFPENILIPSPGFKTYKAVYNEFFK